VSALASAGELTGLLLLALAIIAAGPAARTAERAASPDRLGAVPPAGLVEDRVAGAAALELEEAVGPGDQQYAVPQSRGVRATRDR
jgi:hypothetical protein